MNHERPQESCILRVWHAACNAADVPEGFAHMKRVGPVWSLLPTRFNPPIADDIPKRKQGKPTAGMLSGTAGRQLSVPTMV